MRLAGERISHRVERGPQARGGELRHELLGCLAGHEIDLAAGASTNTFSCVPTPGGEIQAGYDAQRTKIPTAVLRLGNFCAPWIDKPQDQISALLRDNDA